MAIGKKERKATADDDTATPPQLDGLDVPLTLQELKECDIKEMAKDKSKSRRLQRTISNAPDEVLTIVLEKAEPHFMELVRDQYGNYLSQKILEAASPEQFEKLFAQLKPEALDLARDTHGTRAVQKLVEQAISRSRTFELLEVLPLSIAEELARSVTGFHVVGRMIELLPAVEACRFIERLCGDSKKALVICKDQWGCCVVKRCIDRSDVDIHEQVLSSILINALELVQDPYGNYVIQHLILLGNGKPSPYVSEVVDSMKGKIFKLAMLKYSSNVLEKCLLHSSDKDRNKITSEILSPPDDSPSEAVKKLVFHEYGNFVFQKALEVGKEPLFSLLVQHSRQMVQDVLVVGEGLEAQPPNLPAEQMRRLAQKLAKRYGAMMEGLYDNSAFLEAFDSMYYGWDPAMMTAEASSYQGWTDSMALNFPTSYPPGYEPYFDATLLSSAKGKGYSGRGKGRKGSGRGRGTRSVTAKDGFQSGPRVVGYWPNYEICYDDYNDTGPESVRVVPKTGRRAKSKARPMAE
jgi:hypothetical protein